MVRGRFAGARQNEGATAKDGAEKYLQAAVTPNVIEGAPDDLVELACSALDGSRQGREIMAHHLWLARRARCEQDPFSLSFGHRHVGAFPNPCIARDVQFDCHGSGRRDAVIGHDGIYPRTDDQRLQMIVIDTWRTHDQSPCDAIQLDQSGGRFQLVAR
jgi:hypothetical protein